MVSAEPSRYRGTNLGEPISLYLARIAETRLGTTRLPRIRLAATSSIGVTATGSTTLKRTYPSVARLRTR